MMKKYILILCLVISIPVFTKACDICGCGIGNTYIGILPEFHKHIFGIRYRYNYMWTHIGADGNFTYLSAKENYRNIEAWGGWNIGKKFRLLFVIPYSFNEKIHQEITNQINGIGDITINGYYKLLQNRRVVFKYKLLVQSLWLNGGVKLATGEYNPLDINLANGNTNLFQLGTGSYDFNIGAMYDIRLQDMGINFSTNYKITNANKYNYQYGNKININTQVYYKLNIKNKMTLAPNSGVQYEKAGKDLDRGFKVSASGGQLLLGTMGVECVMGKIAIGANFQTPISQNLADGTVKAANRMMVHVAIAL